MENGSQSEHTRKDGQPDQRFKEEGSSGSSSSSGGGSSQNQQGQGKTGAGGSDDEGHPLTKDGHMDKRVKQ